MISIIKTLIASIVELNVNIKVLIDKQEETRKIQLDQRTAMLDFLTQLKVHLSFTDKLMLDEKMRKDRQEKDREPTPADLRY